MTVLDHELRRFGRRTVRELVIVGGGLAVVASEIVRPGPVDPGNLIVYIVATLLFALRCFAARAAGVGASIGACVQQWPHLRLCEVTPETLALLPLVRLPAGPASTMPRCQVRAS